MIEFNFQLLNLIQNYLICGAGIWLAVAFIRRTEPELLKKPILWKALFVVNLIAFFPLTISVVADVESALPSNWLAPIFEGDLSGSITQVAHKESSYDWLFISGLVYLLGLSFFGVRLYKKLKLLKVMIGNSQIRCIKSIATQRQIEIIEHSHIQVKISEQPISPFAFGLFQKRIILPSYIYKLPQQQSAVLIEHELCHIKQGDPRSLLIAQGFCCLFWFNPMNWLYLNQLSAAMEFRVDQYLTQRGQIQPKLYAQTLLDVMKQSAVVLPSAIITHSVNSHHKTQIKQRIISMMLKSNTRQRTNIKSLTCWALMLVSWPFVMLTVNAQPHNQKTWLYPLETTVKQVTSHFKAVHEIRNNKPHLGVDLKAELGTNIVAPSAGKVVIADGTTMNKDYGNVVVVLHSNGLRSFYAHLQGFNVKVGDRVEQGDVLGQVGVTGKSTGPHLHMEVVLDKTHLDPLNFIAIED